MTLPMTLLIVTGEIDLSVASILGMSSALVGYLCSHGWPMPLVIVDRARGRCARRVVQRVPRHAGRPAVARGHDRDADAVPRHRRRRSSARTRSRTSRRDTRTSASTPLPHTGGYLSYSVVIFIVLAVVFGVVLHVTPFGRSLFVIGANDEAARYAGIRVKRTKLILFMASGIVCALAGILYTFRLSTAVQDNGLGLELSVVTIVLLGGVSIFGGRGHDHRRRARGRRLRRAPERALPDELPPAGARESSPDRCCC